MAALKNTELNGAWVWMGDYCKPVASTTAQQSFKEMTYSLDSTELLRTTFLTLRRSDQSPSDLRAALDLISNHERITDEVLAKPSLFALLSSKNQESAMQIAERNKTTVNRVAILALLPLHVCSSNNYVGASAVIALCRLTKDEGTNGIIKAAWERVLSPESHEKQQPLAIAQVLHSMATLKWHNNDATLSRLAINYLKYEIDNGTEENKDAAHRIQHNLDSSVSSVNIEGISRGKIIAAFFNKAITLNGSGKKNPVSQSQADIFFNISESCERANGRSQVNIDTLHGVELGLSFNLSEVNYNGFLSTYGRKATDAVLGSLNLVARSR